MKVLFVTGDHNCECKGSGRVEVPKSFSVNGSTFTIWVKEECDCVEAHEATLKYFDDQMDTDTTMGQVVPEEDFSERYKR